jgi:hypothetical protein
MDLSELTISKEEECDLRTYVHVLERAYQYVRMSLLATVAVPLGRELRIRRKAKILTCYLFALIKVRFMRQGLLLRLL